MCAWYVHSDPQYRFNMSKKIMYISSQPPQRLSYGTNKPMQDSREINRLEVDYNPSDKYGVLSPTAKNRTLFRVPSNFFENELNSLH